MPLDYLDHSMQTYWTKINCRSVMGGTPRFFSRDIIRGIVMNGSFSKALISMQLDGALPIWSPLDSCHLHRVRMGMARWDASSASSLTSMWASGTFTPSLAEASSYRPIALPKFDKTDIIFRPVTVSLRVQRRISR
jgi:hypothetical protein